MPAMKPRLARTLATSVLCVALFSAIHAEDAKVTTKPVPALGELITVKLVAKVQAIDLKTRELTLLGPTGTVVTLTVDPRVKRLAEVKVGDELAIEYGVELAAEIRPATEEEKKNPLATHDEVIRLPEGKTPSGGGVRMIKAVATVESVDRTGSTAQLKGPRGNWANVRVKDPALLASLHAGDSVIVTYTEAMAVELRKVDASK
jgi:hypothetical protein